MKKTIRELKEIWHEVPPDYYQKSIKNNFLQRFWHYGKLRHTIAFITTEPKRVLDVGCASGWFLHELMVRFPKAHSVGIDPYNKAIAYAKKSYKTITFKQADGHKIPYPDNSFDLVVCMEVLEHVLDPEKVLKEIKRTLTTNGTAIIEMDSGNFLFRLVWHWWTHIRKGVWRDAHIHLFNTQKLERMIVDSGLIIRKKRIFNLSMAVIFKVTAK